MSPLAQVTLVAAGITVCLVGSAVFSGLETGVYVLNKPRLELRAAGGNRAARRLRRAVERPQEMLAAILIANNTVNFLISTGAVAIFVLLEVSHADIYTTAVVSPLLFVLGEVVPKNVFRVASETLTYRLSGVLTWTIRLTRWVGLNPLVSAFSRLVVRLWHGRPGGAADALEPHQRVGAMLAEVHAQGVLTLFQSRMANRVIRAGSIPLAEVMVPRDRAVSVPRDCTREEFERVVRRHEFTRLLVCGDEPGSVLGVVNVHDVLCDPDPAAPPARHLESPIRLPHGLDVAKALRTLQRARRPLGLVIDDAGRPLGIVTIKDLVEEIVGDLAAW